MGAIELIVKGGVIVLFLLTGAVTFGQQQDSTRIYKKRVLETTEIDFLTSYYGQDGDNAAVSGGIGTEELTDLATSIVVSIPLNDDDVLTIDASFSAYSSASSSNVDPFDGDDPADPFVESTGASSADTWVNGTFSYSHSSDDRNKIWSAKLAVSAEYDYLSVGVGGSYSRLFNEKNTELSVNANIYLDSWSLIYPMELRPFVEGRDGLEDSFFKENTVTGNPNYDPAFIEINNGSRNSYSLGFGFSQIISKRLQGSLALDLVLQEGLLSTPFQRVYFNDVAGSFIVNFQLADDIERVPDTRLKVAVGGRLNYYLNEVVVIRTHARYYTDDWEINSVTAGIEVPIKISSKFTLYPSYRFYNQTAPVFFAPFEEHLSTQEFYTSDYDLSDFTANQYGFGVTYTDIFTNFHLGKFGLKSIDLRFNHYQRDSGLTSSIIAAGIKFVKD